MFGRITRFAGVADDGSLELYLGLVRERVLPVVRAIPGFRGYLALSDSERAETLLVLLWETEEEAGRPLGARVASFARVSSTLRELLASCSCSVTVWEVDARS